MSKGGETKTEEKCDCKLCRLRQVLFDGELNPANQEQFEAGINYSMLLFTLMLSKVDDECVLGWIRGVLDQRQQFCGEEAASSDAHAALH